MPKREELYISVDIEASGPIPGEYSMLSLGACVVGDTTKTFYIELKPLNANFKEEAIRIAGLSLEHLEKNGVDPPVAMTQCATWVEHIAHDKKPVFVAFNATFDWLFTHWYFIKYLRHDPFGISGLDIKAYFMGKHNTGWMATSKKDIATIYRPTAKHTHNALDDAIEQAEIMEKLINT